MEHKPYIKHVPGADMAVLFIHGFLGSPNHFEGLVELVPEGVGIYNILLDGHGGGVKDFACTSMEKWGKQVKSVVDDLVKRYGNIIIVGHSMGTLFAIEEAVRYPSNVKAITLLQSPLKIAVKPTAFVNTMKSFFNLIPKDDHIGEAYDKAHGVKLNKRVWEYAGWIPRYLELFREAAKTRETFKQVEVPCTVFQSAKDELVSMKSVKYIPEKDNIKLKILQKSMHFIYDEGDFGLIADAFKAHFKE